MSDALASKIMSAAFQDELEKIAHSRELDEFEKVAGDYFSDWDELDYYEKVAAAATLRSLVGKGVGALQGGANAVLKGAQKLTGFTKSAPAQVAAKVKAKPLVSFSKGPLKGTSALGGGKHIPGVGNIKKFS